MAKSGTASGCKSVDLGNPVPKTPDGSELKAFELKASGLRVQVISWGGYITQIHAPDAKGKWKDLVVGFDIPNDFAGYHDGRSQYYGAAIGRFGNRIAKGRFSMNGEEYKLATNNAPNHLHGGEKGWDSRNWDVVETGDGAEPFVVFGLKCTDGEEGYPAALSVTMKYSIVNGNTLSMNYSVKNEDAKKSTVVNVTNHTYFNLSGDLKKKITDHVMLINANAMTAVGNKECIPTGELRPVAGTPFDFNAPKRIGLEIDRTDDDQIEYGLGYDHNFVLSGTGMKFCASVFEPTSQRKMEVFTTEPGVQFYAGNWMDASRGNGKAGIPLEHRTGFCLETQHFPDSPNQPTFPSTELKAGETYKTETLYRFSTGTPLSKPKWGIIAKLNPESRGVNLKVKCVSSKKLEGEGDTWEAVVGDKSGIVTLLLKNEKHASLCKDGAAVRVQNARVIMINGFVRLIVDKWAVLKPTEGLDFEVSETKDVSAVEYELSG